MPVPSLRTLVDDDQAEPLHDAARLLVEDRPVLQLPRRQRRLAGALAVSATFHIITIALLLIATLEEPIPRTDGTSAPTVQLTFEQPPSAIRHVPPPPMPPAPSFLQPPQQQQSQAMPFIPPVGALPKPNRMGEQVPVPPPPKPNMGEPPAESRRAEDSQDRAGKPALGAAEGVESGGPSPTAAEQGNASDSAERGSPSAGALVGSLAVAPAHERGLPGESAIPGQGSKIPGVAKKPQRRGLNYGVPSDTGAFGNFSFEHQDFDWTDYWSVMYWAIWRTWHNRLFLELPGFERVAFERGSPGLNGTAVLRFTIERNGNVSAIEMVTPSGIGEFDRACGDALKEVILPPLPADFTHPRERVTGTFRLDVDDIRAWRGYMNQLKYRGIF